MKFEHLDDYFKQYIQTYLPYRSSNLYQTITENIFKNYFDDIYNNDPKILKQLYEKQEIPLSIVDKLLTGIGMGDRIRHSLSGWEKLIFLQMLSDFQQYKGTIDFLINTCKVYMNHIGIYELYLEKRNPWVLNPELVHKSDLIDLYREKIPYIEVYYKLPSLLVNEDYLDELYQDNELLLPMKTNMLFIDYVNLTVSSLINDLIVSTFLFQHGDATKILYFEDNYFEADFKLITYVWFYVVSEYFEVDWQAFPLNWILKYNSNDPTFPYTLETLEPILEEYNNIDKNSSNVRKELDEFYAKYLAEPFTQLYQTNYDVSRNKMLDYIKSRNLDLAIYLEHRINGAERRKNELHKILSEMFYLLYYHIEHHDNEYFHKYGFYWLYYLPRVITDVRDTPEYKLLKEYKPYHVEIIDRSLNAVLVDDLFNGVFLGDDYEFDIHAGPYVSAEVISSRISLEDEFEIVEYPRLED